MSVLQTDTFTTSPSERCRSRKIRTFGTPWGVQHLSRVPPSTARPYFQFAGIDGIEPTTNGLTGHCSTSELYSRGVNGGARTLDLLIHNQALLPTELQSPYRWSLVELNHVLWIFSPSHTPRLPKLLYVGALDSNLHHWFHRLASYPLNDKSISELHCKGKMLISHQEISASLAAKEFNKIGIILNITQ